MKYALTFSKWTKKIQVTQNLTIRKYVFERPNPCRNSFCGILHTNIPARYLFCMVQRSQVSCIKMICFIFHRTIIIMNCVSYVCKVTEIYMMKFPYFLIHKRFEIGRKSITTASVHLP